jgi:hypothetical protein
VFECCRGHGCLFVGSVVVRYKSLRRADHWCIGVLPSVVRPCLCSRNFKIEEGQASVGPLTGKKKTYCEFIVLSV